MEQYMVGFLCLVAAVYICWNLINRLRMRNSAQACSGCCNHCVSNGSCLQAQKNEGATNHAGHHQGLVAEGLLLSQLQNGDMATIENVTGHSAVVRRLLDVGLIPGAKLQLVKRAPLGDPLEVKVWGGLLTLRKAEADLISVQKLSA